jgi:hypothetical protein
VNEWRKRRLRTIQGEAMHDRLVNEVAAFLKV